MMMNRESKEDKKNVFLRIFASGILCRVCIDWSMNNTIAGFV